MTDLKAVFFDVKGTLFDARACARAALEIVLHNFGADLPTDDTDEVLRHYDAVLLDMVDGRALRGEKPLNRRERFQVFLDSFDVRKPQLARKMARRYDAARRMMRRQYCRPGMDMVLNNLKGRGIAVGVIMNGAPAEQRALLNALGLLETMDYVVLAEAEGYNKPDVRLFRRVLEMYDLKTDQVLYVGDSPVTDVLGAQRAGVPVVWFDTGGRRLLPGTAPPDFTIQDLGELLPITRL
jgi:putative hydrolase of the HAD superfamily